MQKILIICYYGFSEPLDTVKNELNKLGYDVIGFPLLEQYNLDEQKTSYYRILDKYIKENNPQYILWWCFNIYPTHLKYITSNNPQVKNYLFNWDDPYCWYDPNYEHKIRSIERAFITSEAKFEQYQDLGCKPVLTYPGYNKIIHFPIKEHDLDDIDYYHCDISICCTNLYSNKDVYPDQIINRFDLVNDIYNNMDKYGYKFHIYGPEFLQNLYPRAYKKELCYIDTNKVFNYSKINICTHVTNGKSYLNERVILILASGGLLFVDPVDGINSFFNDKKDEYCVTIDKNNYLTQIKSILDNYQNYKSIKTSGHNFVSDKDWFNQMQIITRYM